MSTNRGIFESFPNQPTNPQDSPFAVAQEPSADQQAAPASPFAALARQDSPFTVADDGADAKSADFGKSVKIPERRKVDSPFQVAEPSEGFGFEAPAASASPFSTPAQSAPASPFTAAEPERAKINPTQAAIAAFGNWQESAAPATPAAPSTFAEPAAPALTPPAQVPAAFSPAPQAPALQATPVQTPASQPQSTDESLSDSFNIRQLELRAIFGVDREMTADEILQRSRALPGMKNVARLAPADIATIDALKNMLPSLGFGGGALKLYSGSVPMEFIREGPVMLAVQTDGGFAPGVRETLMIVARELGRMA